MYICRSSLSFGKNVYALVYRSFLNPRGLRVRNLVLPCLTFQDLLYVNKRVSFHCLDLWLLLLRLVSLVAFSKIFIGGLSFETTDEALKRYFEQFGAVADAIVMKDAVSRRSRGFGFITYMNSASVDAALSVKQHVVDNRRVEAKRAVPRSEVPSKVRTQSIVCYVSFLFAIYVGVDDRYLRQPCSVSTVVLDYYCNVAKFDIICGKAILIVCFACPPLCFYVHTHILRM